MKFKLEIEMDNAAYQDDFVPELLANLDDVKSCLEYGGRAGSVSDSNGNRVGFFNITVSHRFDELND